MKCFFVVFCLLLTFYGFCADEKAQKRSLAIFDFTDSNGFITDDTEKITLLIFAKLSKNDKIKMIERSELDKVLKEQDFSQSGIVSQDSMLKLGKFLGAENILNGKIYSMDGKVYFNGKLTNCMNGKISGVSMSFDSKDKNESMSEVFAKKVADHIVDKFDDDK